jgi:hypothetical protein
MSTRKRGNPVEACLLQGVLLFSNLFLVDQAALSQIFGNKSSSSTDFPSSDTPVCYVQMEDGTFLDLTHLCGRTEVQNDSNPTRRFSSTSRRSSFIEEQRRRICNAQASNQTDAFLRERCAIYQ